MKIEERRFVAFGVAAIEVDLIVAVVGAVKRIDGTPTEVIIVMLETGGSITLSHESKDMVLMWWKENMMDKKLVEKIELPAPVTVPVPAKSVPAQPVTTAPTPDPATTIPNIVAEVNAQVSPTPPPVESPVKPPSLSDIGKS